MRMRMRMRSRRKAQTEPTPGLSCALHPHPHPHPHPKLVPPARSPVCPPPEHAREEARGAFGNGELPVAFHNGGAQGAAHAQLE
jgi:hypothetical protein